MVDLHKLLIIASDFPPLAGTNIRRTQGFVKHLSSFGWQSTVITRAIEDMDLVSYSEAWALPRDTEVVRVRSVDPFSWLRRARRIQPIDVSSVNVKPRNDSLERSEYPVKPNALRLLARTVISQMLKQSLRYTAYLPDPLMPWGYMAARRAIGLAQQQHFDVLLTSCPSYSSHVAGLLVKKRIGIPWVADFRDLWVDRPYRHVLSHWHRYVDKRLERAVIRGADQIILASPPWKVRFRETYGESLELKMTVITNGFDREETESKSTKASMDNEVVFVYTGAMYGSESPAPFLEVLARLKSYAPHLIDPVRVRLIGYAEDELASLLDIIHRAALQEHVAFLPPQPHSRCLMEQMSADVLLLFSGPQHQETIRGKSFEYMATGKPILALIPEHGVQAELLRKAGTAFIVQHGDVTATERVVRDLITQPQLRSVRPNWDFINSFDRRALTAQLAEVLDTCAKRIRLNSKPYERQDTAPRIWP